MLQSKHNQILVTFSEQKGRQKAGNENVVRSDAKWDDCVKEGL